MLYHFVRPKMILLHFGLSLLNVISLHGCLRLMPYNEDNGSSIDETEVDMTIVVDMTVNEQDSPPCDPNCPNLGFVQIEGGVFLMGSERG